MVTKELAATAGSRHSRDDVRKRLEEMKKKSSKYTEADRERAIDLLLEGKDFDEIAEDIGCTSGTVEKWCNDYVDAVGEEEAGDGDEEENPAS